MLKDESKEKKPPDSVRLNLNAKNKDISKIYGGDDGWEDKLEIKNNGSRAEIRQWRCKFCRFSTITQELHTAHVTASHWDEYWRLLKKKPVNFTMPNFKTKNNICKERTSEGFEQKRQQEHWEGQEEL